MKKPGEERTPGSELGGFTGRQGDLAWPAYRTCSELASWRVFPKH